MCVELYLHGRWLATCVPVCVCVESMEGGVTCVPEGTGFVVRHTKWVESSLVSHLMLMSVSLPAMLNMSATGTRHDAGGGCGTS